MEKYDLPVGHLPGHNKPPEKEYVVMDKKKKINPKDVFVGYKEPKKIKKVTAKHKVKFIINDYFILTSKIKADGCHMGQLDGSLKIARKKLKGKILGITCHNSKILALNAIKNKADYIAFGSFFKSRLKPSAKKSKFKYFKMGKKKC